MLVERMNRVGRPLAAGMLASLLLVHVTTLAQSEHLGIDYRKVIVAGDPDGTPTDSPALRVDPNTTTSDFGGVGSIRIFLPDVGAFICSGTPITDRHILTAGHCLDLNDNGTIAVTPANVTFRLNFGSNQSHIIAATALDMHPDFTGFGSPSVNDDLSLLTLSEPLPAGVPIYPLYRPTVTAGTTFTLAGYGRSGTGVSGYTVDPSFSVKRSGQNNVDDFRIDDEGGGLNESFEYDFDRPTGNGQLGGPTLGNDIETTVGGGDSGGPSFVSDGGVLKIAGVNTFTFRFGPPFGPRNPNAPFFGSGGGGILVGPYASWIDGLMGPDKFWDDPTGGSFGLAPNWVGGVPTAAGDTARFDLSSTYAVTFSLNPMHLSATVGHDDVTFSLSGSTYALTSAAAADPSLVVGEDADNVGRLTIENGTLAAVNASLGKSAGASGEVILATNAILSLSGRMDVGGIDDTAGGTGSITIGSTAVLNVLNTLKVWTGSTVDLQGGMLIADVIDLAGGTWTGVGTADVTTFQNTGSITPGASTGQLQVLGEYIQDPLGALEIELAGSADFDALNISGAATLDGTLDVVLLNPFFPTPGETFEVMTFASHSGEFSSVTGDVGLLDSTTFLLPLYSSTNLLLFTAIPGDGNLDGAVTASDYTLWANNFELPGTGFTTGDYNGDGFTTASDYTLWANNFGMMVASPVSTVATVPEPSTFVLLFVGAIALLWRRT